MLASLLFYLMPTTFLGIFFSTLFTTHCRKIEVRSRCITKHHLKMTTLFSPTERGLTSVSARHSSRHRQCIVHSQGMNSIIRESVSISCRNQQRFKGSIQRQCSSTDFVAAAQGSLGQQWPMMNTDMIRNYLMKVLSDVLMEESYPWHS